MIGSLPTSLQWHLVDPQNIHSKIAICPECIIASVDMTNKHLAYLAQYVYIRCLDISVAPKITFDAVIKLHGLQSLQYSQSMRITAKQREQLEAKGCKLIPRTPSLVYNDLDIVHEPRASEFSRRLARRVPRPKPSGIEGNP